MSFCSRVMYSLRRLRVLRAFSRLRTFASSCRSSTDMSLRFGKGALRRARAVAELSGASNLMVSSRLDVCMISCASSVHAVRFFPFLPTSLHPLSSRVLLPPSSPSSFSAPSTSSSSSSSEPSEPSPASSASSVLPPDSSSSSATMAASWSCAAASWSAVVLRFTPLFGFPLDSLDGLGRRPLRAFPPPPPPPAASCPSVRGFSPSTGTISIP
mmetsp:Transcript_46061/g.128131  ORF Transcript_46061/g.128131 Transcript_46061/m.128131 type:complete len:213 (-) Transcript_46061:834-1472(-)